MSSSSAPKVSLAKQRLILVDGSSYIFRAYHALPPLTRKSDGVPVGAVAGFCNMLWKMLADNKAHAPTHFAVIFDASSKTFRNEIYDGYKAHRPEAPEDLRPQFGLIREAVKAFGIPALEMMNYEADDLIATYARLAEEQGMDVVIISSDKDLMQLVTDKISMLDTMKEKWINREEVIEKFGVPPEQVVDVQSLAGDSVDAVPGVPGIGIKTAAQLISEFGSLENLLEKASTIKQQKRRESLIEFAEQARISKRLVALDKNAPLPEPLEDLTLQQPSGKDIVAFCKAMEFNTLTRRVAAALDVVADEIEPAQVPVKFWPPEGGVVQTSSENNINPPQITNLKAENDEPQSNISSPRLSEKITTELRALKVDYDKYQTITNLDALKKIIARAYETGTLAIDTETNALDAQASELVGISLSAEVGEACYIPLTHRGADNLFGGGKAEGQLDIKDVAALLREPLRDASLIKIGQNIKYDLSVLARYDLSITPIDDTLLMSYVLDAGRGNHGMDELAKRHLEHNCISFKDVTNEQKSAAKDFSLVSIKDATRYAAEDADITLRLWKIFKHRLVEEKMLTVYETLERPLVPVLQRMEAAGVLIDRQMLSRLSGQFAQTMGALEEEATNLAGEKFNLGSPKQLGEILFGKLQLPGGTKTASGQWATGADVLDDLAAQGHDIAKTLLEWRQLSKLKSTYTDALPTYINPKTGRVHTSFALASTTTGRLSSSEPNVQNIPVRTEEGRKIRSAFIAASGTKILSADYSQIELRVLAHVADIPNLKKAFANGIDIHAMTASEMFGVPVEGMDPMVRRKAKAINFGIIYGISAFGLANQLGIPREEAGQYIRTYFERFPGIKAYMENAKQQCRELGYVTTLFGRRCHYPGIQSKNAAERAFNERAAINAPIQGSAADIIRRAMIRMEDALVTSKLNAKMLMQVHDELVFEVPDSEIEKTLPVIKNVMEKAAEPAQHLSVPLVVDARAAENWEAAH